MDSKLVIELSIFVSLVLIVKRIANYNLFKWRIEDYAFGYELSLATLFSMVIHLIERYNYIIHLKTVNSEEAHNLSISPEVFTKLLPSLEVVGQTVFVMSIVVIQSYFMEDLKKDSSLTRNIVRLFICNVTGFFSYLIFHNFI